MIIWAAVSAVRGNNGVNVKLRQIPTATWNYKTHTTMKMPNINTTRCEWRTLARNEMKKWTHNMRFSQRCCLSSGVQRHVVC
jgi:hypothetical protein